jgi:hypothetical protein
MEKTKETVWNSSVVIYDHFLKLGTYLPTTHFSRYLPHWWAADSVNSRLFIIYLMLDMYSQKCKY